MDKWYIIFYNHELLYLENSIQSFDFFYHLHNFSIKQSFKIAIGLIIKAFHYGVGHPSRNLESRIP